MYDSRPYLKLIDFLFSKLSEGVAYCKIVTDKAGKPIDWVYIDVNAAFERIIGMKKVDVIGKKGTEIFPKIERNPVDWIDLYGQVALTGEPTVTERYLLAWKKWCHVSAYCPEKGYFIAVFEDISARKKAEGETKKARDDWERTFDAVPDLIALLDTDYRIVRVNKAMAEQLGTAPDKVVGLKCYECIHAEKFPPKNCPHTRLLKDEKQHIAEVCENKLGGNFLVSATPLRMIKDN